jgi:hypothetical protein
MTKKKDHFVFLCINLGIILIFFTLLGSDHNFIEFINTLFYISFFYFLLFLSLFTSKGGFFDGLVYSFRRFNHVMFHSKDYLEEWKEKPLPSENINLRFYQLLKVQTGLLIGLLIILLVIFYM